MCSERRGLSSAPCLHILLTPSDIHEEKRSEFRTSKVVNMGDESVSSLAKSLKVYENSNRIRSFAVKENIVRKPVQTSEAIQWGKRICGSPDRKKLPPPIDTSNTRGITAGGTLVWSPCCVAAGGWRAAGGCGRWSKDGRIAGQRPARLYEMSLQAARVTARRQASHSACSAILLSLLFLQIIAYDVSCQVSRHCYPLPPQLIDMQMSKWNGARSQTAPTRYRALGTTYFFVKSRDETIDSFICSPYVSTGACMRRPHRVNINKWEVGKLDVFGSSRPDTGT
ncbi:hypothetical protein MSG28_008109 [Choristoneura fumiferana]|uniref:Uncharacterized protein n=1 Tax=Choristoneura fumiferana TaxID=7141 RepID=A0ACC0JAD2_CHOFU|nr:hypothetical protein MSG28_008109 [Choristoneura fumiferana]